MNQNKLREQLKIIKNYTRRIKQMDDITRRYIKQTNNRGNKMLSPAMQLVMAKGKSPIDNLIEHHRRMSESMFSERFEKELKEEVKEAVSKQIRDYSKR